MSSRTEPNYSDVPADLKRRFELAHTDLTIGGRAYQLVRPRSVDDLISEEDFAIDERIPYWADCWPSARILASLVAEHTGAGRTLLELGCGIGLVSLVAAAAGYQVLATDYYADSLEFTAANAERHTIEGVDTRLVDWRKLPADLGTFDVVVAADVLYEREYAELVASVIARSLAPGGRAIVTDPGRRPAEGFVAQCQAQGLQAALAQRIPTVDGETSLTISVYEIERG
jgi:ETFB lysine methyltransferase